MSAWARLVRTIFRKELVDGIRDRRALASALAFPVLGPVLVAFMFTAIAQDRSSPPELEIPVAGAEHAPGLVAFLEVSGASVVAPPDDIETAVSLGDVPVVVVIEEGFDERLRTVRPASVELVVDTSRLANRTPVMRVERLLEGWASQTATQRVVARGLDPTVLRPLDLEQVDVATPSQRAANMLEMLVMMAVMAAFLGSMYLAMDSTAGERERRSLEPLLSLPVPRSALVGGKFLASLVFGVAGVLLATTSMVLAMDQVPLELLGVRVELSLPVVGGLLAVLLPLVPLAAAAQLLVAAGATSFKEAQTWLSMTLFLPMAPGMVMTVRPVNPQAWMPAVPGLAQQVLAGKVLRGEGLGVQDAVLTIGSSVVLAAACLVVLTWLLDQERVLRRG